MVGVHRGRAHLGVAGEDSEAAVWRSRHQPQALVHNCVEDRELCEVFGGDAARRRVLRRGEQPHRVQLLRGQPPAQTAGKERHNAP